MRRIGIERAIVIGAFVGWMGMLVIISCDPPLTCEGEISANRIDPSGSPCKKLCECNNLHYTGICQKREDTGKTHCLSRARGECSAKGEQKPCKPIDPNVQCVGGWGVQVCSPQMLSGAMFWGDCRCEQVVNDKETIQIADGSEPANDAFQIADGSESTNDAFQIADGSESANDAFVEQPSDEVSCSAQAALWSCREECITKRQTDPVIGQNGVPWLIAYNAEGSAFASGSDLQGNFNVWDAATGKRRYELKGHTKALRGLAFSAVVQTLVSGSQDGTLIRWDLKTGKEAKRQTYTTEITAMAAFTNSDRLAVAVKDRSLVFLQLSTLNTLTTEPPPISGTGISDMAWNPNGTSLLVANESGLSHWTSKKLDWSVPNPHSTKGVRVRWHPKDHTFFTFASFDNKIKKWSASDGTLQQTLQVEPSANNIALHPDGEFLAIAIGSEIRFYNLATGEMKQKLDLLGSWAHGLMFHPKGRELAVGAASGIVTLLGCR